MPAPISGEVVWRRSRVLLPVAAPAAGTEWLLTVPAGHVYTLLGVSSVLVTSAVAPVRVPRLVLGDGSGNSIVIPAPTTQAASLTGRITWLPSSGYSLAPIMLGALPGEWGMETGWTIGSSTGAIDAGDQYSAIVVAVIDATVLRGAIDFDELPDTIVRVLA